MISIIGIGNAGCAIAEKFESQKNYKVFKLSNSVKTKGNSFRLEEFESPEHYEENVPDLGKFFSDITDEVQVFVVGSAMSSNYTLGILQQIRDKSIELFYVKPDIELLTGIPKLVENVMFGVLQEYARSGLFKNITILSNLEIEKYLDNVSIKSYYDSLNTTIFCCCSSSADKLGVSPFSASTLLS